MFVVSMMESSNHKIQKCYLKCWERWYWRLIWDERSILMSPVLPFNTVDDLGPIFSFYNFLWHVLSFQPFQTKLFKRELQANRYFGLFHEISSILNVFNKKLKKIRSFTFHQKVNYKMFILCTEFFEFVAFASHFICPHLYFISVGSQCSFYSIRT